MTKPLSVKNFIKYCPYFAGMNLEGMAGMMEGMFPPGTNAFPPGMFPPWMGAGLKPKKRGECACVEKPTKDLGNGLTQTSV